MRHFHAVHLMAFLSAERVYAEFALLRFVLHARIRCLARANIVEGPLAAASGHPSQGGGAILRKTSAPSTTFHFDERMCLGMCF
mmetsp:Transcript_74455/g.187621  ORF Transcript_74455/g.187621 Transcript_74455/m.187621 type:complete len:84 (+) Transcript_74455:566-817(+)